MTRRGISLWWAVIAVVFGIAVVVSLSASRPVKVVLIINVTLGFIALADALVRRRSSFRRSGMGKGRWLLFLSAGTMLAFGAIPAVWYFVKLRAWRDTYGPLKEAESVSPSGDGVWGPPATRAPRRVNCDGCRGTGRDSDGEIHYACGGRGFYDAP
jgi:hypothetical protein